MNPNNDFYRTMDACGANDQVGRWSPGFRADGRLNWCKAPSVFCYREGREMSQLQ